MKRGRREEGVQGRGEQGKRGRGRMKATREEGDEKNDERRKERVGASEKRLKQK